MEQRYHSGEAIHNGDQVLYAGQPGSVAFVIDRAEYSPEFPAEHWSSYGSGFMLRHSTYGLVFLPESDEDLELVARA